jgi:tRNA (guanine37-N1)-methyltransferase
MVLMAPPVVKAIEASCGRRRSRKKTRVVLLSPQGSVFTQEKAKKLSKYEKIVLVCGHYGGVDERILKFVDEELSIGDYVLTGGELPAMVVTDTVIRILPGSVGKIDSLTQDSHWNGTLATSLYTRPQNFRGSKVPDVLMSGNHREIEKWRNARVIENTKKKRPDLLRGERNGKFGKFS